MQITNKSELRKYYKSLRLNMSDSEKESLCKGIAENFLGSDYFKSAENIYVYVSSEIEVDTLNIISRCFAEQKRVYAPRCYPNSNLMNFYEIKSFDSLEKGSFGILEPKQNCLPADYSDLKKSVCLVPALAYDMNGFRLGFGKGFYDRFLCSFDGLKIGLCYQSCLTDKLFRDFHDIPTDILITEKNIYSFNNQRG